ncbi:hypothetical protein AQUCO_02800085v1 [Aquilegia coerulea]|uniref:Uncharacterized protein n=1 Tax=Aquilegia coerulea TaxID=218851 RepID=A0A2G5D3U2_AQUCA|nr:hypothetical protein AQUCO_02800085v1 [Aquilegia coerulea]
MSHLRVISRCWNPEVLPSICWCSHICMRWCLLIHWIQRWRCYMLIGWSLLIQLLGCILTSATTTFPFGTPSSSLFIHWIRSYMLIRGWYWP